MILRLKVPENLWEFGKFLAAEKRKESFLVFLDFFKFLLILHDSPRKVHFLWFSGYIWHCRGVLGIEPSSRVCKVCSQPFKLSFCSAQWSYLEKIQVPNTPSHLNVKESNNTGSGLVLDCFIGPESYLRVMQHS